MIIEISKIGRLIIITSKSVLIDFPMPGILGKAKSLLQSTQQQPQYLVQSSECVF